jgi:hypothetical protein
MAEKYKRISISYKQHRDTGLLCAFSEDLRGLTVFARTPAQLCDKTLRACEDLVEAITGERPCYQWENDAEEVGDAFMRPQEKLGELVPCL